MRILQITLAPIIRQQPEANPIFASILVGTLIVCWPHLAHTQNSDKAKPTMSKDVQTVVIVHGAFGGRHQWKRVAEQLEHQLKLPVVRVGLTGQGERSHLSSKAINLDTHVSDVVNLIEHEDLNSICLIGHSYGGVLISAVSDKVPERIKRRIYLDAYLLDDGENFFSHHPDLEKKWTQRANEDGQGWLVPVDWKNPMGDVPHPLATLKQSVQLRNNAAKQIASEYWLFTDGGTVENDHLKCFFDRAKERGWQAKSFSWDHNPHRNAPDELTKELYKAITGD